MTVPISGSHRKEGSDSDGGHQKWTERTDVVMKEIRVAGTASRGIVVSRVLKYEEPDYTPCGEGITAEQAEEEQEKFENARQAVKAALGELAEQSDIFAAHLAIMDDFVLLESVGGRIAGERKNAQAAVYETIEELASMFDVIDDPYMRERGADVRDIGKRLMAELKGIVLPDLGSLKHEMIVAAKDLYPSDTVRLDPAFVKGIITEEGGITSHVSIIAGSLGIPILAGVGPVLDEIGEDTIVCMDAGEGILVLDPDEETLARYHARREAAERERIRLKRLRTMPTVTKSGRRIRLCVNAGSLQEIEQALPMNIDGVGLFRSELLYMEGTQFPTEEEQFEVYKKAAILCPGELTVRTLDIGGDKNLPYFEFDREENPFLGWRAIRISLDMKDMFKQQLRAILRAGAFGHVRILLPLLISLEELWQAKAVVRECMEELRKEKKAFDGQMEIGMMIETPASVLLAEEFAREADFFSIGTNDLTQYLLAVDRGNQRLAGRYDYFHPAVQKAVAHVIEAGHGEGIQVGMCGEMAGDPQAVPLLLEMGLDEFSMSVGSIDYVRERILGAKL